MYRFPCASMMSSALVGTPPAYAGVKQADKLFPIASPMLGAGQRGLNPKHYSLSQN
jgi:hypothetical protein